MPLFTGLAATLQRPFDPSRSCGSWALIQETVRAYYTGWYKELVTELPEVSEGHVSPSDGPGLGTELLPGLRERPDAHPVASKLED